ncbi:DNA primase family protein [Singulisphaera sp. PoT]|uniref:DNA primase family protein n=1 Tax=Singulisphaera sp. PoT TaxID=3411797 RepID=UPI003BF48F25
MNGYASRAGKGTILRSLKLLIGEHNTCAPSLLSMAGEFGLSPMIGKLAAIFDDVQLDPRTNMTVAIERLLSITGDGSLDINRKNREHWIGKLSARVTMASNEMLRLSNSSGSLDNRMLALKFVRTFQGREDFGLDDALAAELPGILLWSLEGLRQLLKNGRFTQPASGAEAKEAMRELNSPILAFLRECCVVDAEEDCERSEIYERYRAWCTPQGIKEPWNQATFGRNLNSAIPGLKNGRPRVNGGHVRTYVGVGLKPPETLVDSRGGGQASDMPF